MDLFRDHSVVPSGLGGTRAEQYRLWLMVVGQDTELVPVTTTAELEIVRENLPSNATVHVALSAMNNGGEGVKSAVVIIETQ